MITQRIRILNNVVSYCNFRYFTVFSGLELNELTTLPAWIVESISTTYIDYLTLTPTTTGTYYYYFTLGGSPPTNDALLIVEVVQSLTNDLTTCNNSTLYELDRINSDGGRAKINLLNNLHKTLNPGDYIYVTTGTYFGYQKVYNVLSPLAIVIDVTFTIAGLLPSIYIFDEQTITIVWITREGGRCSYIFDERVNYKGIAGAAKTFDNNGKIKYINRGKNYIAKEVYKSGISQTEVDLLESLRNSIQAYEYNEVTNILTPIIIDVNNYNLYNTKENFNEVSFNYKIAQYKEIQNQ